MESDQELLKEKNNSQLKGNRKGIIVKGKEFYIPIRVPKIVDLLLYTGNGHHRHWII